MNTRVLGIESTTLSGIVSEVPTQCQHLAVAARGFGRGPVYGHMLFSVAFDAAILVRSRTRGAPRRAGGKAAASHRASQGSVRELAMQQS